MKRQPSYAPVATKRPLFSGSRSVVLGKQLATGLAWGLLWGTTLLLGVGILGFYYLDPNEQEGFAAMVGLLGVPILGPLGFLASLFAGRMARRVWLFLAGAPVTSVATLAYFVVAYTSPGETAAPAHGPDWDEVESVIRSAHRAPEDGRSPEDRLLFILGPDERKGLIDTQGRIVVEPRFDWALSSSEGRAMVASEDRHGYVDGTGRLVIEPQWAQVSSFHEGLAVVTSSVAASRTFWGYLFDGVEDPKRGYIDRDGNVAISPRFADALPFSEGVAWVQAYDGRRWGVIDRTGAFRIEPRLRLELGRPRPFTEGLCPVWDAEEWSFDESVERFGYIDTDGAMVIPPRFRAAGSFSEGLAAVVTGGRLGFIDRSGALSIPAQFEWGSVNANSLLDLPAFSDGLAAVRIDGRYGFIDKSGQVVIEPRYEKALGFSDGLAAIVLDKRTGFIDREGHLVIEPQFTSVNSFEDGIARVEVRSGQWGYVRRDGTFLWHPLKPQ